MVKIYCIEDCNGLKYVGSTKRTLNKRLSHHRSHNGCMSRKLILNDCKIYILEECDEEHRKVREQYWIDHTECVNKYNTIVDRKKYYENNKDYILKYKHNFYEKNKDKIKEQQKIYHQQNRDKKLKYQLFYERYRRSWGGDPRYNNNLLKINLDIFL
jgi:hypothetical protein